MEEEYCFVINKSQNKKSKKEVRRTLKYYNLKKIVFYPHLLEEEDIKCEDVIKYNKLKNEHKVVPVIKRWKNKFLFPKNYTQKEYEIPESIERIGLPLLRSNYLDQKELQSVKDKHIDKIFPKFGNSSINPKKLYECLYTHEKPYLYKYGEVFDFTWEHTKKQFVPGFLTKALKNALGMTDTSPPPWLFKMQKLGLPPSYPNLEVKGVNCDIPTGCKYGYEPGGWGKNRVEFELKDCVKYKYNYDTHYTSIKPIEELNKSKEINEQNSKISEDFTQTLENKLQSTDKEPIQNILEESRAELMLDESTRTSESEIVEKKASIDVKTKKKKKTAKNRLSKNF